MGGDKIKPEILEMHKRLQPLYREKMGEIRTYDSIQCEKYDWVKVVIDCSYADDRCYEDRICDSRIFIPLLIDPCNPERGLMGMLKSNWTLSGPRYNDPVITTYGLCLIDWDGLDVLGYYEGETPEEAILKALCQQEKKGG